MTLSRILAMLRAALLAARAWINPKRRQALQGFAVALVAIFAALGHITPAQGEAWVAIASAAVQGLVGLLALVNLTPRAAAAWFSTVGRGAIYAAAAFIAPSLQVVGLLSGDQVAAVLQALSLGLTTLAALVAVLNAAPEPEPDAGPRDYAPYLRY